MSIFKTQRGGQGILNAYEIPITDTGMDISPLVAIAQMGMQSGRGTRGDSGTGSDKHLKGLPGHNREWITRNQGNESAHMGKINEWRDLFENEYGSDVERFMTAMSHDVHSEISRYNSEKTELKSQLSEMERIADVYKDLYADKDVQSTHMVTMFEGKPLGFGRLRGTDEYGWAPVQFIEDQEILRGNPGLNVLAQQAGLGQEFMFPTKIGIDQGKNTIQTTMRQFSNNLTESKVSESGYIDVMDPLTGEPARQTVSQGEMFRNNIMQLRSGVANIMETLSENDKLSLYNDALSSARWHDSFYIDEDGTKVPHQEYGIKLQRIDHVVNEKGEIVPNELIIGYEKDPDLGTDIIINPQHFPDMAINAKAFEYAMPEYISGQKITAHREDGRGKPTGLGQGKDKYEEGYFMNLSLGAFGKEEYHSITTAGLVNTDIKGSMEKLAQGSAAYQKRKDLESSLLAFRNEHPNSWFILSDPSSDPKERANIVNRVARFTSDRLGISENEFTQLFAEYSSTKTPSGDQMTVFDAIFEGLMGDIEVDMSTVPADQLMMSFYSGIPIIQVELPQQEANAFRQYHGNGFAGTASMLGGTYQLHQFEEKYGTKIAYTTGSRSTLPRPAEGPNSQILVRPSISGQLYLTREMMDDLDVPVKINSTGETEYRKPFQTRRRRDWPSIDLNKLDEGMLEYVNKNYRNISGNKLYIVPADLFIDNPHSIDQYAKQKHNPYYVQETAEETARREYEQKQQEISGNVRVSQ